MAVKRSNLQVGFAQMCDGDGFLLRLAKKVAVIAHMRDYGK
jgi:hypothetical protein